MMKNNQRNFSVKLFLMFILFNLIRLTQATAGATNLRQNRQRHLIHAPKDVNVTDYLPEEQSENLEHMLDTYKGNSIYSTWFSNEEFAQFKADIAGTEITGSLDDIISIPNDGNDEIINAEDTPTQYLTALQSYNLPVDNIAIAIMDTKIASNHSSLSGVKIHVAYDYTSGVIGSMHGSKVAYIFAGNTGILTKGNRSIENYVVFDDKGTGHVWTIIDACKRVLELAKLLAKKNIKLLASFSGTSTANYYVDEAFRTLSTNGVTAFSALGNNHASAYGYSPAREKKIIGVGGTTQGTLPAYDSNWLDGEKVIYLPYCVMVPSFIDGRMVGFCGTSGSTPQAAAYQSIFISFVPNATADEVKQDALDRAVAINPPAGSGFSSPMYILPTNRAFPNNPRLAASLAFGQKNRGTLGAWYDGTKYDKFCVKFAAQSSSGWLKIIIAAKNSTQSKITVTLGRFLQNRFAYTIKTGDGKDAQATRPTRLLSSTRTFKLEQESSSGAPMLTLWMKGTDSANFSKLVAKGINATLDKVAFTSNGAAKYYNIMQC